MRLLQSPWGGDFERFARSVRKSAIIAAPYISGSGLARFGELLPKSPPPRVEIITNLNPASAAQGTLDLPALADFVDKHQNASVHSVANLHAKVYVADEHAAIVTSGNLTDASLYRNREYGVDISSVPMVQKIAADLREYAGLGFSVSPEHLNALVALARDLREKYRPVFAPQGEAAKREFDKLLGEIKESLLLQRAANPDPDARGTAGIFAKTIMYSLHRGAAMKTSAMHMLVKSTHPDLCDDTIYRVINGMRFGKKWKHDVRNAQQLLKKRGLIELSNGVWRATTSARKNFERQML